MTAVGKSGSGQTQRSFLLSKVEAGTFGQSLHEPEGGERDGRTLLSHGGASNVSPQKELNLRHHVFSFYRRPQLCKFCNGKPENVGQNCSGRHVVSQPVCFHHLPMRQRRQLAAASLRRRVHLWQVNHYRSGPPSNGSPAPLLYLSKRRRFWGRQI